ncbi:MAG: heme-binding protein, partial [Propionibacteriaceae bacterium]|nr:heme-binding protein [Propionibacteriaceae bacterium]
MSITLKEALSAIDASIAKAEAISVPVVVSVVDAGGHMIAQAKMDDCIYASISISYYKAQTAIFMKMATHELAEVSQPGKALWGLGESSCGNLILFGGGFLV